MDNLRLLTDVELLSVGGGWHPFPKGIFGRDGKPFFGKDLINIVIDTAPIVIGAIVPPLAPAAAVIKEAMTAANIAEKIDVIGHNPFHIN